jgi:TolA-binding protein
VTDDALAPFLQAYRAENPGAALDALGVRRRVLVGIGARQRRRFLALRFALPVAATFIGSVALAASHGALPRFDEVREWLGVAAADPPAKTSETTRRSRATGAPRSAPTPPVVESPSPAEPPVPLSFDDLPAEPEHGPRAPDAPRDPLSADLAAYREAHELHFRGGDPGRALVAWDAFLASHPKGTFAPEARFNRAICLLRLGRRSEAMSVLIPIADSSGPAYGRERARALLEAMEF